jgi:hypothetical protein
LVGSFHQATGVAVSAAADMAFPFPHGARFAERSPSV